MRPKKEHCKIAIHKNCKIRTIKLRPGENFFGKHMSVDKKLELIKFDKHMSVDKKLELIKFGKHMSVDKKLELINL